MTEARRRAEDYTFVGKIAYYSNKYSIFWIPLLAFLTAMGFGFKTPAQQAIEFTTKITVLDSNLHVEVRNRHELDMKIDILLKLSCINSKISKDYQQLIGLNCEKILDQ